MTIEEKFKKLIDIAEYLNDSSTKILLRKWENEYINGKREVGFVGRFSAGKSSLLNALLGWGDILPSALVETTASITKISFSENTGVFVTYQNGISEEIPLEKVKELSHITTKNSENKLDNIDIYFPSKLLENGLVLIDSPGTDTVLNEHIQLAQEIMEGSLMIVYVMNGAPTAYDIALMKNLINNHVALSVVRTHIDNLKEHEESFNEVIYNDEKTLRDNLGILPPYFALSKYKDRNSNIKNEYQRFEKFLQEEASNISQNAFSKALNEKLDDLAQHFKSILKERIENLKKSFSKTEAEINSNLETVKKAKLKTQSQFDSLHLNAKKELANVKLSVVDTISNAKRNNKKSFAKAFSNELENNDSIDNTKLNIFYHEYLSKCIEETGDEVTGIIEKWCNGRVEEISEYTSEIKETLAKADLDFDGSFNMSSVNEITERQQAVLEEYEDLMVRAEQIAAFTDEKLEKLKIDRESINKVLEELNSVRGEYNEAIEALQNSYSPHFIEKPSKLGKVFKRIGTVADIAMLLVPAAGWTKAGTFLASKAATLAAQGGKLAKAGSYALKGAATATKFIAATDTAKDMTYLVDLGTKMIGNNKEGNKTYNDSDAKEGLVKINTLKERIGDLLAPSPIPSPKKKTNIFDYFSLSYWFGKAGEFLDPPKKEIDMEYERQYREAVDLVKQQSAENMRRQMEEYNKLRIIQSEEEDKKFRQKIEMMERDNEKRRLEKEQKRLESKKTEAIKTVTLEAYNNKFIESLDDTLSRLERKAELSIDLLGCQISSAAAISIENQLDSIESQLNQIISEKENVKKGDTNTINILNEKLTSLTF